MFLIVTSSCDNLAPPVRLCTQIVWHNYTAVIELASIEII